MSWSARDPQVRGNQTLRNQSGNRSSRCVSLATRAPAAKRMPRQAIVRKVIDVTGMRAKGRGRACEVEIIRGRLRGHGIGDESGDPITATRVNR